MAAITSTAVSSEKMIAQILGIFQPSSNATSGFNKMARNRANARGTRISLSSESIKENRINPRRMTVILRYQGYFLIID